MFNLLKPKSEVDQKKQEVKLFLASLSKLLPTRTDLHQSKINYWIAELLLQRFPELHPQTTFDGFLVDYCLQVNGDFKPIYCCFKSESDVIYFGFTY